MFVFVNMLSCLFCWESVDLLALLYVMFSCQSCVTCPYAVAGHVWCLVVSISDLCRLTFTCIMGPNDDSEAEGQVHIYIAVESTLRWLYPSVTKGA